MVAEDLKKGFKEVGRELGEAARMGMPTKTEIKGVEKAIAKVPQAIEQGAAKAYNAAKPEVKKFVGEVKQAGQNVAAAMASKPGKVQTIVLGNQPETMQLQNDAAKAQAERDRIAQAPQQSAVMQPEPYVPSINVATMTPQVASTQTGNLTLEQYTALSPKDKVAYQQAKRQEIENKFLEETKQLQLQTEKNKQAQAEIENKFLSDETKLARELYLNKPPLLGIGKTEKEKQQEQLFQTEGLNKQASLENAKNAALQAKAAIEATKAIQSQNRKAATANTGLAGEINNITNAFANFARQGGRVAEYDENGNLIGSHPAVSELFTPQAGPRNISKFNTAQNASASSYFTPPTEQATAPGVGFSTNVPITNEQGQIIGYQPQGGPNTGVAFSQIQQTPEGTLLKFAGGTSPMAFEQQSVNNSNSLLTALGGPTLYRTTPPEVEIARRTPSLYQTAGSVPGTLQALSAPVPPPQAQAPAMRQGAEAIIPRVPQAQAPQAPARPAATPPTTTPPTTQAPTGAVALTPAREPVPQPTVPREMPKPQIKMPARKPPARYRAPKVPVVNINETQKPQRIRQFKTPKVQVQVVGAKPAAEKKKIMHSRPGAPRKAGRPSKRALRERERRAMQKAEMVRG